MAHPPRLLCRSPATIDPGSAYLLTGGEMSNRNFFAKWLLCILSGALVLAAGCAEKSATRVAAQSSANRVATADPAGESQGGEARLQREVRHQLIMLTYY